MSVGAPAEDARGGDGAVSSAPNSPLGPQWLANSTSVVGPPANFNARIDTSL